MSAFFAFLENKITANLGLIYLIFIPKVKT